MVRGDGMINLEAEAVLFLPGAFVVTRSHLRASHFGEYLPQ